jgi:thymidylate synthase
MIAHVLCDMDTGEFIHTIGDVYKDHIEALKVQIERKLRAFVGRNVMDINDFKTEDFIVENYTPHGEIVMPMSV